MKKHFLFILSLLILLSACRPIEDPRAMAQTSLEMKITETGCRPVEFFVPMGEEIIININNETEEDYSWYILFYDNQGKFDPNNKENIIAHLSAPANKTQSGSFTAPITPAKYMTICCPDTDPDRLHLINLLVVDPY